MTTAHILVVQDDRTLATALTACRRPGAEVVAAPTARQGRALVATAAFTVLLVDLALPDGSGLDVLVAARAPETPSRRAAACVLANSDPTPALSRANELGAVVLPATAGIARIEAFLSSAAPWTAKVERTARRHAVAVGATEAEADVLRQLLLGACASSIARARGVSVRTVRHQVSALLHRSGELNTGCRSHRDAPFRGIFPVTRWFRAA